jgi:tetratricopeptide (TPR) repeat protein
MKIFQKILSHGLLIAFFVAVFFIYLYRGELFPQWFDQQARSQMTPEETVAKPPAVVAAEDRRSGHTSAGTAQQDRAAVPARSTAGALESAETPALSERPSAGRTPAVTSAGETPLAQYRPLEEDEAVKETYHPLAPKSDKSAGQYRPVQPEEVAKETYHPGSGVPENVGTTPQYRPLEAQKVASSNAVAQTSKSVSRSDFRSQLEQARQHYWQRDVAAAEQLYRQLTQSYPERAEVWGELGNLYFGQREMVQATDAYYRAIELWIEQGNPGRARQLLGAMYQLDTDRANELETRLRQAGG